QTFATVGGGIGRVALRAAPGGFSAEPVATPACARLLALRIRPAHEPRRNRQLPGPYPGDRQPAILALCARESHPHTSARNPAARHTHAARAFGRRLRLTDAVPACGGASRHPL